MLKNIYEINELIKMKQNKNAFLALFNTQSQKFPLNTSVEKRDSPQI